MFKNALIYTLTAATPLDLLSAEVSLGKQVFAPCGPTQDKSAGWVPPRGQEHGALIESVGGQWVAKFQIETKAVPGEVVKRKLAELAAQIEQAHGRKPGKKETRELREAIVHELLPHAFPKTAAIWVWIDRERGRIVLDTSSRGKADEAVTALVRAIDGINIGLLNTQVSPQAAMTSWLFGAPDQWPEHFAAGRHVELRSSDEAKALVKFDRHHLDDEQMRLHIGQGKLPTKLALDWEGRVSFVLTEGGALRKIDYLDGVLDGRHEEESGFDADVAIATGELGQLIDHLTEAMGGELK
jgi:recombination associated protein RdgC